MIWALFAALLGCAIVYRFVDVEGPAWAATLLTFGAGTAIGIGLTSCLSFALRLAAPGWPRLSLAVEAACFAWVVMGIRRRKRTPGIPIAGLALAAATLLVSIGMWSAWKANPQGNWDAWAMWNLKARFLASNGELARRAWSPALAEVHPEYPLLLPGFVARCWTYSGSIGTGAPIATAYLFFLSLLAMVTGGFALLRGPKLGLLLGMAIAGTPPLLHEVWAQYADVPLACYFAAAMIFALLDRPVVAGLFAGLAAWTKDEGVLFLAVFLTATLALRRRQIWPALIGAIPGASVAAFFKLALAPAGPMYFRRGLPSLIERAGEPGRFHEIAAAFGHQFAALEGGWYHPLLPAAALMITLRFDPSRRPDLLFCSSVTVAMLAGYFGVFLITPYPLKWQLDSSLDRLIVQVWPILLVTLFAALRSPDSARTA